MVTNGQHYGALSGVIRHRENDKFYAGEGRWCDDEGEAMEFRNLWDVATEATKYHIKDCCEFVLRLVSRPELTVFIPL